MTPTPTPAVWSFATRCYDRPGVAAQCLAWQDLGVDVCLLLCAAWLEQRAVNWTPERAAELTALAERWQSQVVAPLRTLRRAWKAPATQDAGLAGLRSRLQQLELAAERQLLERLEESARKWPASAAPAPWLEPLLGPDGRPRQVALLRAAAGTAYSPE